MNTLSKIIVEGRERLFETVRKREGRFLCFKVTWEEVISIDHAYNDIVIKTDRPIRSIFLNGKEIKIKEFGI